MILKVAQELNYYQSSKLLPSDSKTVEMLESGAPCAPSVTQYRKGARGAPYIATSRYRFAKVRRFLDQMGVVNHFWNMLDQVLLRPSLLTSFDQNNLKVIDRIDEVSLINNNGKISNQFSDHLPIMIKLEISQLVGDN